MKHAHYYYLFCLLLFFFSCKETEKEKITRLVKGWQGKEIKFPDNPVFTVSGKDTVDFKIPEADYTVITYVDSIGCTSCKLQLDKWSLFISETDSMVNGSVSFLFFFHPKDKREISYTLKRDRFIYPVCIDDNDRINALNKFPADMTFQTFLLDKSKRVVAMGNPVHNSKIKKLV